MHQKLIRKTVLTAADPILIWARRECDKGTYAGRHVEYIMFGKLFSHEGEMAYKLIGGGNVVLCENSGSCSVQLL